MKRIEESIQQAITLKSAMLEDASLLGRIADAASLMIGCLQHGGKIHFCGNGGSAADAQHLAAELSGRFYYDRPPLNAEALHVNSSFLTAVSNDYGYEMAYARMMQASAKKGDVLVGISTSGNSSNVVKAYEVCKELGVGIISLTGADGGAMRAYSDVLLNVPSTDTPRIQEAHIMVGHILCELVEKEMFPRS